MGPTERAMRLARHILATVPSTTDVEVYALAYAIDDFWQRENDKVSLD